MTDFEYMQKAILLGENGRITAPPNPWVGCILVKNGRIIGQGYSQPAGCAHAEICALQSSTESTHGATAYVTLEPCAHTGLTPPCANALIEAKVAKVVIALEDPDPRVSGKGISILQENGIEVILGVCSEAAAQSLAPYLHHRISQTPYCILKMALSIDGKIAAADGTSKWISSIEARHDAQRLRAESQAILIGSETALKDDPALTVRNPPLPIRQPLRVILDTKGRLTDNLKIFDIQQAPTLIVTGEHCPTQMLIKWEKWGVEVATIPLTPDGLIDLKILFELLGKRGILQILVEGGAKLHGSILKEGLCQRLMVYLGGCLLGENGMGAFKGFKVDTLANAPLYELLELKKLGNSAKLIYSLNRNNS